jgi:hypothetical protein
MVVLADIVIVGFVALFVLGFLRRHMPRVGGKFGPTRTVDPLPVLPSGFSRSYAREVTLFVATDASRFPTLKAFLRDGTAPLPAVMRIYCIAGCKTEIEIPEGVADYERIEATQALALLRELPDMRRVRRLHLSDERSFFDPWVRKVRGEQVFHLGHANNFGLIVLYRPDRHLGQSLAVTLLHEWLHLVAFASTFQLWRFRRANAIEPLPPLAPAPLNESRNARTHEAWSDLGEKLLGYDESVARQAALEAPVHAMILWRCVERMLLRTPLRFRSTRFDQLRLRGDFMRAEVAPMARARRAK